MEIATDIPTRTQRASLFFAEALGEQADLLQATLPRVLRRKPDEEAIHDMRVAIRRLRVMLKVTRAIFGRFHTDWVRGKLTAVHRATSLLRDEEVLTETLSRLPVRDTTFKAWVAARARRQGLLRASVTNRLHAGEVKAALVALRALITLPARPSREVPLERFAHKVIARAQHEVADGGTVDEKDVDGLHDLRIAYKHLRYAGEMFANVIPNGGAIAASAAKFQKVLGEIHDFDVAKVTLERARGLDEATHRRAKASLDRARASRITKLHGLLHPPAVPRKESA